MKYKVTDENLVKFSDEIINATEMLQLATLSLRTLYVAKSSSVNSFVKLRKEITNEAKIYSKKVLPVSNELIRAVQHFCNLYDCFSFFEFKFYVNYFLREAKEDAEMCKLTLRLNKNILEEFKNRENEVIEVLGQLELKTEEYEQKKEQLLRSADVKHKWAIGLALVPGVNIIASPILYVKGNKNIKNSIAESEEGILTVAAADTIRGPLITSLTSLVSTFDFISKFFIALIDELNELATINDDYSKEVHYNRMKIKGPIIVNACRTYISNIPDAVTNLRSIPDDYDKNYVQKWLSEKS